MSQMPGTTDIAIIGGGILGASVAYFTAKDGADCVVLERHRTNAEASGTNAGNLHIQLNPHEQADVQKLHDKMLLSKRAWEVWKDLSTTLNTDLGVQKRGGLVVAETEAQLQRLEAKAAYERSIGIETHMVSQSDLRKMAPALTDALLGAAYLATEGFANPFLATPALLDGAKRYGAVVHSECEVLAIERATGAWKITTSRGVLIARRVVNAAGAWAGRIAAMVGLELPIIGRALHMNVTEPWPALMPYLIQHCGRRITMKQTQYGTFVIGGGWPADYDPAQQRSFVREESIAGSLNVACTVLPGLRDLRLLRSWAGMLVLPPAVQPVIGEVSGCPGFYCAVVASGFTNGPAVGEIMSAILHGREPPVPVAAYRPDRALVSVAPMEHMEH